MEDAPDEATVVSGCHDALAQGSEAAGSGGDVARHMVVTAASTTPPTDLKQGGGDYLEQSSKIQRILIRYI